MAVPSYLGPCGSWIACQLLRCQLAVLTAQLHAVFGPGAVGTVRMPVQGPLAVSVRRRAPLWDRRCRKPRPARHYLVAAAGSARLGCSGGGGVSIPSPPLYVLPWESFSLSEHPGCFSPKGKLFHYGGVNYLRRLDYPYHSLAVPPGGFFHSGGLVDPLSVSHSIGLSGRIFPPARVPHPFPSSCPMADSRSCCGHVPGCGVGGGALLHAHTDRKSVCA